MSIETIPGTNIRYFMVNFDKDGRERRDDPGGHMSECVLDALREEKSTDIFIFIHGWKGDVPAARHQYAAWMTSMMSLDTDRERASLRRPGFAPLLVGMHWPSLPFGDEDMSPVASFAVGVGDELDAMVDRCAGQLADTERARAALRTIFVTALNDPAPQTLSRAVRDAYQTLNRESGLDAAGVAGSPSEDREPFDPDVAYASARNDADSFGSSILGGLLSPLVQLSFWKMKDRARRFGESGGFSFLEAIMKADPRRDARVHLMGHSFGCIAASAAVAGPSGARLPGPIYSLVLVQGALSLWSYCLNIPSACGKAGYFRRLVDNGAVTGPIVTTQSVHDLAVGRLYPIAAGVSEQVAFVPKELPVYGGFGTYGARGDGLDVVDLTVKDRDAAYDFRPGKIYNVECSRIICDGPPPSGAHSDIAKPEVSHLVWAAALSGPSPQKS